VSALVTPFSLTTGGAIVSGSGNSSAFSPAALTLNNTTLNAGVRQIVDDSNHFLWGDTTGAGQTRFQMDLNGNPNGTNFFFYQGSSGTFNVTGTGASRFGGDVNVTSSAAGLVLTAPNGSCWRVTVSNAGALSTASITCP
jgi:hypothetical protein